MRGVELQAKWDPAEDYRLGPKDIEGKSTYLGSRVWRYPKLSVVEKPTPKIGPGDVLVKVRACGICGTDVHMAQAKEDGRIMYPGFTAFPTLLGHEFSGTVVEAGEKAIDKLTNKRFEVGAPVCSEEMMWCGSCRPCTEGYPNHCEALQEVGITIDGAFAEYIKVPARHCWNLSPLLEDYGEEGMYLSGSLVEPTSVAHNAVIERGGGIRPGDYVVIMGGGPVGLAATAILKRCGARKVIVSQPSPVRAAMAVKFGADVIINPRKEDFVSRVLEETNQLGATLYLEASGVPEAVWDDLEKTIWHARGINATIVAVARTETKMPVTGEVLQVRRAKIVGSQGHSGHGTFPRVINMMASGMDMTKMVTSKISLDEVPEHIIKLQTDRTDAKISYVAK